MHKLRAFAMSVALVAAVGGAYAFTLEPIMTLLAPTGAGSVATFRVKGDGQSRVAIRFRVITRDMQVDGSEINTPADDLFLVYPARVVVEPNGQAAVKVQWKGPAKIDAERCFRFVAEQVPLDTGAQGSGIKIMFKYIASLYIGGPSFSPSMKVKVIGAVNAEKASGFLVEIANAGSRHVVLASPKVTIGSTQIVLGESDLGVLAGANYLPGRSRSLFILKEGAVEGQSYDSSIEFEAVY
ncbi:MAG: fimbria/pilus periplasmic chaperone [Spirochaetota bacterium]